MRKLIVYMALVTLVFGFALPSQAAHHITVKKGDSMWSIAKRYKVSFAEVLRLNKHHTNQDLIHPEDKVYIPNGSTGTKTSENSASDEIANGSETSDEAGTSTQAEAVLKLVNAERSKQGLPALTLLSNLTSIATEKSKDMAVNGYFDHNSPTYGTPFQMLQTYGIHYMSAGENIAAGQRTAQEVMQSWMNSSGHRANILSDKFDNIGIGYYQGGSYGVYWTQLFTGN